MKVELPEITPDTSLISVGNGHFDYDVIVVGGGNAAACAAIEPLRQARRSLSSSEHHGSTAAVTHVTPQLSVYA